MTDAEYSDRLDPASELMGYLQHQPSMVGVPMYVTYDDGSRLSLTWNVDGSPQYQAIPAEGANL